MPSSAARRLLAHYDRTARSLPWRSPPGAPPPDPYRVWLSEVMLQQTTVATVTPRFVRFLERWPTVEALAAAPDAQVMGEWAGLGYYARARNLLACARAVAGSGGFPATRDALRTLPGLGDWNAIDLVRDYPEIVVFSSDYPHTEGNTDPMGLYRPGLGALDAEVRNGFLGGTIADCYERMGDPVVH